MPITTCRQYSDQTCCGMRNYGGFSNQKYDGSKGMYVPAEKDFLEKEFKSIFSTNYGGYATLTKQQYEKDWGAVLESFGFKAQPTFRNPNTNNLIYIMIYTPPVKK